MADRVNINFEFELFGINKKSYLNTEFEYVYFFFPGKVLANARSYPQDYLDYLVGLGIEIPEFSNEKGIDWWGVPNDLAKDLNSKITAVELGAELCPAGIEIVNSILEIEEILKSNPEKSYIIRDPYLAAGTNSKIIKFKENLPALKSFPAIIAPFFERVMDLGFIFENSNIDLFWNLNSKAGKFKGGIVFKNDDDLYSLIESELGFNKGSILKTLEDIFELYKNRGAQDIIQIDSFFYKEEGEIKFYPLVEANCRKTFGLFINRLKVFLPQGGVGIFINLKSSDLIPCESFTQRLDQLGNLQYIGEGIIPISSQDGLFSSFFLCAQTLKDLNQMILQFWENLGKKGKKLSPAFNLDQFI